MRGKEVKRVRKSLSKRRVERDTKKDESLALRISKESNQISRKANFIALLGVVFSSIAFITSSWLSWKTYDASSKQIDLAKTQIDLTKAELDSSYKENQRKNEQDILDREEQRKRYLTDRELQEIQFQANLALLTKQSKLVEEQGLKERPFLDAILVMEN